MSFKDVNGTEIKVGDYIYHAASYGRSAVRQERLVVVGFTPRKIRAVSPEKVKIWDRNIGDYTGAMRWQESRRIEPGSRIVVVNEAWPEAEEYLRDNYLWHLKETA